MIWNFCIHIIAGILGSKIFTWTSEGIIWCIVMTFIIQGISMFQMYQTTVKRIRQQPLQIQDEQMRTFRKRLPIIFPQLFIAKLIGYGLLTMASANILRIFTNT